MEILSIKMIDIEKRIIHISKAKTGARQQPTTSHFAGLLQSYIFNHDQNWLFPAKNSATEHTMNIEKPFKRVVTAAGLDSKQVLRHTLRHTVQLRTWCKQESICPL
jgi:integrase